MSKSLPDVVIENQSLELKNEAKEHEHDVNRVVNEDNIASNNEGDDDNNEDEGDYDYNEDEDDYAMSCYAYNYQNYLERHYNPYYYDIYAVSDHESFTSSKPVADPTEMKVVFDPAEFQPINGVDCPAQSDECDKDKTNDNESVNSTINEPNNDEVNSGSDKSFKLIENDLFRETIKNRFISGLEDFGVNVKIEHMDWLFSDASDVTRAKLQTFAIYTKMVNEKTKGHADVRHAWFGGSKDQIDNIILHGFSHDCVVNDGTYGSGLYLSTDNAINESVKSSTADDDGTRRILVCRVILGKVEVVKLGSKQFHPRCDKFQTGVDSFEFPTKLIVWSAHINTHVLPEYVISFKTENEPEAGIVKNEGLNFSLMPSKALAFELSKYLDPEDKKKIFMYHSKFIERKISRHDMFVGFSDVTGDKLLKMVVKEFKEQQLKQDKTNEPVAT